MAPLGLELSEGLLRWQDGFGKKFQRLRLPAILAQHMVTLPGSQGRTVDRDRGGGLAWRHGDRVDVFNRANGLAVDIVCSILEDDRQTLWLGTYEGIIRVKKSECEAVAGGRLSKLGRRFSRAATGCQPLNAQAVFSRPPAGPGMAGCGSPR